MSSLHLLEKEATLMWAACCVGFFGFMRSGEFTTSPPAPAAMLSRDVAMDSHSNPQTVRLFLRQAKNDPFKKGVHIYLGRSGKEICPVNALLRYMAIRPSCGGPLFVWEDATPLTRDQFIQKVKAALNAAEASATRATAFA